MKKEISTRSRVRIEHVRARIASGFYEQEKVLDIALDYLWRDVGPRDPELESKESKAREPIRRYGSSAPGTTPEGSAEGSGPAARAAHGALR